MQHANQLQITLLQCFNATAEQKQAWESSPKMLNAPLGTRDRHRRRRVAAAAAICQKSSTLRQHPPLIGAPQSTD